MKLAVTGFFTILATRKAHAKSSDDPSTTEILPHLPPPALFYTKSPPTIQARPNLTINRDPTRALLLFGVPQTRPKLESALQPLGLVLEDYSDQCGKSFANLHGRVVHSPTQFWIRSLNCQEEITRDILVRLIRILGQDLAWIGPVYKDPVARGRGAFTCAMPNVLLIKLRTKITPEQARRFSDDISLFGFKEDFSTPLSLTRFRRHRIRKISPKTAYELRDRYLSPPWNRIVEQVLFSYLPMLSALATTMPRDAWYRPGGITPTGKGQWNMWRIRAGFDPSATCVIHPGTGSGWDITRGSNSVVIWMIDVGWDYDHPDLKFFPDGIDFRSLPDTGFPEPPRTISTLLDEWKPRDAHGTMCAGVLTASINFAGITCNTQANGVGVAGLAGECSVFPLAITDGSLDEFANAIEYARNHMTLSAAATARILSISMGKAWTSGGFPEGWYNYEDLIEPVLDDALSAGMIICAASGNSANDPGSTSIWYPASKEGVLACGASDQQDFRARTNDWGSCYGPELSVVAPGIEIPTTYWPDPKYIDTFGKTSAAVPHVAGLAALLLSYKPCLTARQVKNTIEQTADKVNTGTYSYQARPNGHWNEEVGYGRINVKNALESVSSRCLTDITPPRVPTGLRYQ